MNYTLVCTIANTVLHIIYKCVREYMVSDYRWLTLHVESEIKGRPPSIVGHRTNVFSLQDNYV